MLKERVLEITKELVKIYSPTNTAEEQKVEQYLLNLLQGMPYFKAHPELCGAFVAADDCFQRSTIYGLVLGKSKKTVVFMGHHDVVSTEVYGALESFPKKETYALCDQLRRAVISIPSNIAEGMGRMSIKEQIHFIEIAFGSLYEVMCQIELAKDLNYITEVQFKELEESVQNVAKPLSGLRSKRKKILNTEGIKGEGTL